MGTKLRGNKNDIQPFLDMNESNEHVYMRTDNEKEICAEIDKEKFERNHNIQISSSIIENNNGVRFRTPVPKAKLTSSYCSFSTEKKIMNASSFLFRSPVTSNELSIISEKVRKEVEYAQEVISRDGYEAYLRLKSRPINPTLLSSCRNVSPDEVEEKGMDSDDEADLSKKRAAAALNEAVVRGHPRRYQTALFELAKRQNTIVHLGTGQGKTLIALLLIRHLSSPAYENGKQTLFLVPSIALAVQHTTTLVANLPYTVATACNASTKSSRAREELFKANIVVATHGAAKDLLMHYGDMFSLSRVNLLVVDECHYATGEHGYASILHNFYHRLPRDNRPRVLGLTASPLVNVRKDANEGKLDFMLCELESRLDSTLACCATSDSISWNIDGNTKISQNTYSSVKSSIPNSDGVPQSCEKNIDTSDYSESCLIKSQAEERSVHYHNTCEEMYGPWPDHENIGLHESRIKEFNQLRELYNDLGPKLTSIYASTLSREVSMNRYEKESKEQFGRVVGHLKDISRLCHEQVEMCSDGGKTEKIAVLEELLEDVVETNGAEDTVGVVFVDRRITALALYDYFRARVKGIEDGTWVRVANTRWCRKPKLDDLNFDVALDKYNGNNVIIKSSSIHNNIHYGKNNYSFCDRSEKRRKLEFDISTSRFEDAEIEMLDFDKALVRNALEETLPDSVNMEQLALIEDKEMFVLDDANNNDKVISNTCIMSQVDKKTRFVQSENIKGQIVITRNQTIRCDMLVRHTTQIFKYLDKSHHFSPEEEQLIQDQWLHQMKKIRDVLDGLRAKRTNVLIATSVIEEGVDVDACSFVIVFDHLKSTKAYVQMKGRARQKDAKFYVFQNETPNASNPYMSLQVAQEIDRRVRRFIETRTPNVPLTMNPVPSFREYKGPSANAEVLAIVQGEYRADNGMVDLSSARSLLNRYTLSIPMDASARSTRDVMILHMPSFEDDRLMLPSHLPSEVRCVVLPETFRKCTKKEKQNMLALMACVRLHKLNLLNSRLLPLQRRDMQKRLLTVALTELATSSKPPAQKCSPIPGNDNEVYIYTLYQTGEIFNQNNEALGGQSRLMCLISLVPFPSLISTLQFTHPEIGDIMCNIGSPKIERLNASEWTECSNFYTMVMNARWRRRTGTAFYRYSSEKAETSIIPPYVIGCLSKDGSLDWERMRRTLHDFSRTEEERIQGVKDTSVDFDLSEPKIWCPIYDPNVCYIVYGPSNLTSDAPFPDQQKDIKTYQDYMVNRRGFDVSSKSRLFAVQRQWHLPRKVHKEFVSHALFDSWKRKNLETDLQVPNAVLQDGERSPCRGLVAALLPHDACMEAPIPDASLYLHCLILPQILFHMDQITTAELFVRHCLEHLPILGSYLRIISKLSLDDILEAITARSCAMGINYDRLEYLGDAVLKMIHTDALLNSRDLRKWVGYLHEGDLTMLRSAMGSNKRLMSAAKSAGLDRFILVKQLGRGQWVPVGLRLHSIDDKGIDTFSKAEEILPGKKVCADVVESLLGLIYIKHGFKASFDVANEMGITLARDADWESISHYEPKKRLMNLARTVLGTSSFKRPELLEEAFTHPSCIHEDVPCYQRLEWVGDAVLCLFSREWAYIKYSKLHVAELVMIEATIVCNETLAYVSVINGLQQHLNHRDPSLPARIEEFERSVGKGGRGLWATDPPKCLPDLVEAMFGSVHVDKGFDAGQRSVMYVLDPIIVAVTDTLLSGSKDINDIREKARTMMHPKQFVHEMAGGIIQVKAWSEESFALRQTRCPVWRNGHWGNEESNGYGAIGVIESFGIDIISIAESSSHVARNRACAICMEVFMDNHDLIDKLTSISMLLRTKEENSNNEKVSESKR